MMRPVWKLLVFTVLTMLAAFPAHAEKAKCLIVVSGKTYLHEPCEVRREKDGSFSMGASDKSPSKYFAYVTIDDPNDADHATGNWNGVEAESHAQDPLGTLTRNGDCWSNSSAKICIEH